jgi:hypothetical protein
MSAEQTKNRMPPARRWKCIQAQRVQPGDIICRQGRYGAGRFNFNPIALVIDGVQSTNIECLHRELNAQKRTGFLPSSNYIVLDVKHGNHEDSNDKWHFHYYGIQRADPGYGSCFYVLSENMDFFIMQTGPCSNVLIINENYEKEKLIQKKWKLDNKWYEHRHALKAERREKQERDFKRKYK